MIIYTFHIEFPFLLKKPRLTQAIRVNSHFPFSNKMHKVDKCISIQAILFKWECNMSYRSKKKACIE